MKNVAEVFLKMYSGFAHYFLSTNRMISKWMCIKHQRAIQSVCCFLLECCGHYYKRPSHMYDGSERSRIHSRPYTGPKQLRRCVGVILRAWSVSKASLMWKSSKTIASKKHCRSQPHRSCVPKYTYVRRAMFVYIIRNLVDCVNRNPLNSIFVMIESSFRTSLPTAIFMGNR